MFKYILLCTLLAHAMWAKPVHEQTELAPHVLIVTPQAQVRLDSLLAGTPIIQHLSPVTRFIAPHEETIVYVPASAADIIARSLPSSVARQDLSAQIAQITQTAAQNAGSLITGSFAPGDVNPAAIIQSALTNGPSVLSQAAAAAGSSLVSGASSFAPSDWPSSFTPLVEGANALGTAATAASAAATAAGSGFISGFTQIGPLSSLPSESNSSSLEPSPVPAPALASAAILSPDLPLSSQKIEKLQYEIPITPIVLTEPRHHYIIGPAPAVPHLVDFVQGPILLAPALTTIQARNLAAENKEKPIIAIPLPESLKPEASPFANDQGKKELIKDIEKKAEFKRFLEANALKEDLNLNNQIKATEKQKIEEIDLEKTELELKSVPIVDDEKDEIPQSKVA